MVTALCSVVPVRLDASEESEQLTQLLWGEICEVVDSMPRWTKIRSTQDGQEGWVDFKMVQEISDEHAQEMQRTPYGVVQRPMAYVKRISDGQCTPLTLGTHLPSYHNGRFTFLGEPFIISPAAVTQPSNKASGKDVVRLAKRLLHVPYLWAGKNCMGTDCSGLTQVVYACIGVQLLRNAREQITQGTEICGIDKAQAGDLMFFDHADRDPKMTNISHVGIYMGNGHILHASGEVHIDSVNEQGIYTTNNHQTHHLAAIHRYI